VPETMDLLILDSRRKRQLKRPILYIEDRPEPSCCPYCQREFTWVIGSQKQCLCGYIEGCED